MPDRARTARVLRFDDGEPRVLAPSRIASEALLEQIIEAVPSLLGIELLMIARQVSIDRRRADLLALDSECRLCVIELKAGSASRDVVSQIVSYFASAKKLTLADLEIMYSPSSGDFALRESFAELFQQEIPEELQGEPQLFVVAEGFSDETQEALAVLQSRSLQITAVTFLHFRDQRRKYLIRTGSSSSIVGTDHRADTQRILSAVSSLKSYIKSSEHRLKQAIQQEHGVTGPRAALEDVKGGRQLRFSAPYVEQLQSFFLDCSPHLTCSFVPTSYLQALYLKWSQQTPKQSMMRGMEAPTFFGRRFKEFIIHDEDWQHAHPRWTEDLFLEQSLLDLVPGWRPPLRGQPVRGYARRRGLSGAETRASFELQVQ